jgi:hypothetical protein
MIAWIADPNGTEFGAKMLSGFDDRATNAAR